MTNQTNFPFYKSMGDRIRGLRVRSAMSQATLGEIVGLSRTSITNIEQGRQQLLVHQLVKMASAFNVDPNDILPEQAESSPRNNDLINSGTPLDDWFNSIVSERPR